MGMGWNKAGFGGTTGKSGGGKLDAVTNKGDKAIPSGLPGKSSLAKSNFATPTTTGDKGIPPKSPGKGSGKAPRD